MGKLRRDEPSRGIKVTDNRRTKYSEISGNSAISLFSGCGRKRSDPSFKNLPIDDEQEDDGMTDDWNQFDSNYPGAYRTQDGQRRYGFFPGIFRKKRSEQTVKSSSS